VTSLSRISAQCEPSKTTRSYLQHVSKKDCSIDPSLAFHSCLHNFVGSCCIKTDILILKISFKSRNYELLARVKAYRLVGGIRMAPKRLSRKSADFRQKKWIDKKFSGSCSFRQGHQTEALKIYRTWSACARMGRFGTCQIFV